MTSVKRSCGAFDGDRDRGRGDAVSDDDEIVGAGCQMRGQVDDRGRNKRGMHNVVAGSPPSSTFRELRARSRFRVDGAVHASDGVPAVFLWPTIA
jgi:hypothetical protein